MIEKSLGRNKIHESIREGVVEILFALCTLHCHPIQTIQRHRQGLYHLNDKLKNSRICGYCQVSKCLVLCRQTHGWQPDL